MGVLRADRRTDRQRDILGFERHFVKSSAADGVAGDGSLMRAERLVIFSSDGVLLVPDEDMVSWR